MKNFAAFLFCGVLAGVFRPRGNGCNHHNHHHDDHDVGQCCGQRHLYAFCRHLCAGSQPGDRQSAGRGRRALSPAPARAPVLRQSGSGGRRRRGGGRPHLEQRLPPRTPPPLPPSPLLLVKNKEPGFVPALLPMRKNVPKLQGKPHLAFVDDCGAADGDGEKRSRVAEIHVGNDGLSLKIRTETLNHKRQLFAGDRGFFLETAD